MEQYTDGSKGWVWNKSLDHDYYYAAVDVNLDASDEIKWSLVLDFDSLSSLKRQKESLAALSLD
jgi:hypothetical protein